MLVKQSVLNSAKAKAKVSTPLDPLMRRNQAGRNSNHNKVDGLGAHGPPGARAHGMTNPARAAQAAQAGGAEIDLYNFNTFLFAQVNYKPSGKGTGAL